MTRVCGRAALFPRVPAARRTAPTATAWPTQVVAIPVAGEYGDYLDEIVARLRTRGVRAEVDHSDDRMQKKIRTHTTQKVPIQLIAGEQDRSAGTVSFRFRDGTQTNGIPVDEAIDRILTAIAERTLVDTAEDLA